MTHLTEAENQLITTLAWFRSRYALFLDLEQDRKADKNGIEAFGRVWIGNFKCKWDDAFDTLIEKGILASNNDEYRFTEKGELLKKEIESKTPFYKYEYDQYFDTEKNSPAHAELCRRVYGKDLSQHGLIDMNELAVLIEKLHVQQPESCADLGCGNGKITEYLAGELQTRFTGIDISSEGIQAANSRTEDKPLLHFEEGNLNNLMFKQAYDAILFLDTLYYAEDLKNTINQAMDGLSKNGRLYAYFSQWIMDTAYSENLQPNNTHLAKVLMDEGLNFTATDLSTSGINHWKRKLQVLEEMKPDFIEEGSLGLWEYRYREAVRYANWGDDKYARYLYEVWK